MQPIFIIVIIALGVFFTSDYTYACFCAKKFRIKHTGGRQWAYRVQGKGFLLYYQLDYHNSEGACENYIHDLMREREDIKKARQNKGIIRQFEIRPVKEELIEDPNFDPLKTLRNGSIEEKQKVEKLFS